MNGPVYVDPSAPNKGGWQTASLVFKDNIVYSLAPPGSGAGGETDSYGTWRARTALRLDYRADTTKSTMSNNLYSNWSYIGTPGDKVFSWDQSGHACSGYDLNS